MCDICFSCFLCFATPFLTTIFKCTCIKDATCITFYLNKTVIIFSLWNVNFIDVTQSPLSRISEFLHSFQWRVFSQFHYRLIKWLIIYNIRQIHICYNWLIPLECFNSTINAHEHNQMDAKEKRLKNHCVWLRTNYIHKDTNERWAQPSRSMFVCNDNVLCSFRVLDMNMEYTEVNMNIVN